MMSVRWLAALVFAQIACMGAPSRVQGPPGGFLVRTPPELIWATLSDGQELVIEGPRVIRDTVFGFSEGQPLAVPTDNVREVKVRRLSLVRSAVIPAVLGIGVVGTILLVKPDPAAPLPVDSTDFYSCRSDPACNP